MRNNKRLRKAEEKIAARKKRLLEYGVSAPSKIGCLLRRVVAPVFRFAVRLMYPKSGCVVLGKTGWKEIERMTSGKPVIYAITHRGIFDVARLIAYALPHVYLITGDEIAFYCTINEHLLKVNGVWFFDRKDSDDGKRMIEWAAKTLLMRQSLIFFPEGTPNVYGREMLRLFPGIIRIALDSGAIIVPVGNEIHILRDRENGKISGDINYMMHEDYEKQTLFRPSDDVALVALHKLLKDTNYMNVLENRELDQLIKNEYLHLAGVSYDLNAKMLELLALYPDVKDYFAKISNESKNINKTNKVREYLMKCSVLNEYRKGIASNLNILDQRMRELSCDICEEIDKRHQISGEERDRNHRDYADYCLDVHEKIARKGRSTAYLEFDRFNQTTDESIIQSNSKKIINVMTQIVQSNC